MTQDYDTSQAHDYCLTHDEAYQHLNKAINAMPTGSDMHMRLGCYMEHYLDQWLETRSQP